MNSHDRPQRRVQFDFEIEFSNGGGLEGQAFRLDIDGDDIDTRTLADKLVRELRLVMVREVRILDKRVIEEPHKGGTNSKTSRAQMPAGFIDLSHTIEDGMVTYRGLPAPLVCDHLSRQQSRAHYAPGVEFHIGRIDMVANTGTYIDSPFHRYADGRDVAQLELSTLADLDTVVVRVIGAAQRAIAREHFVPFELSGKAVLIHTGWDVHWRTDRYFEGHPFLTADAAEHLCAAGARLVGIDSLNIDDTADLRRPVHSTLLGAGIPIVEHLCRLEQLPLEGCRFTAVPPGVAGMGTFPVRAFARTDTCGAR